MNEFIETREKLLEKLAGQGLAIDFAGEYAGLMDRRLQELFARAAGAAGPPKGLALAAMGGFGRGELAPYSDVDLLFLTDGGAGLKGFGNLVEAVLYPLWDMKLDVGHAVRTPDQCLEMAREDFATLSTQLDARFLAGDQAVFNELVTRLNRWLAAKSRKHSFFKDLTASVSARRRKYGASPYLLEPNVKEGQGALRDIHAVHWAGAGIYNLRRLEQLVEAGLLSRDRVRELDEAHRFMTGVRLHLHRLSGRKNDVLTFDLQENLSRELGFEGDGHISGVEQFMGVYYTHVYRAKGTLDFFLSRVQDDLVPSRIWRMTQLPRRVEKGLTLLRGLVELGGSAEVRRRPILIMRAFEVSASSGLPLSQRSLEVIRMNMDLVDDDYRRDPAAAASFLRGLTAIPPRRKNASGPTAAMQVLDFLESYIPELAKVKAQVQHDAYHVYTVDVHLVVTLMELKRLAMGERADDVGAFDLSVLNKVKDRRILFLAALLHDIGKGHGHDHARLGAEMIPPIGARLGLGEDETDALRYLVEDHLFLAETATRRDLTEEKLIVNCARRVGDVDRLNMLYLLTSADSLATGPGAMSPWKASLLRELYSKVFRVLTKSDLALRETARRTDRLLMEVAGRLENRLTPTQLDAHLEKMSAHYLSVMDVDQVVRHILLERDLVDGKKQLVWEVEEKDGHCEATILTKDRPGLLSRMAGVFTLHNINILGAQVFTRANNIALDVFQVGYPPDRVFQDKAWAKVREDALGVLTGKLALDYRLAQKRPMLKASLPGGGRRPDEVKIDNETSDFYTIVEVYTYDRLGLLYDVTRTLYDLQLSINIAKISTKADQVVDVFYVRDFFGEKLVDEIQIRELKDALHFTLAR
ncbi:MAG: [protein-PII] uridylyltransferase [Pseudomonadota bacterium]